VVLKWFYSLSRRKTFVGGKCALPSALLVLIVSSRLNRGIQSVKEMFVPPAFVVYASCQRTCYPFFLSLICGNFVYVAD